MLRFVAGLLIVATCSCGSAPPAGGPPAPSGDALPAIVLRPRKLLRPGSRLIPEDTRFAPFSAFRRPASPEEFAHVRPSPYDEDQARTLARLLIGEHMDVRPGELVFEGAGTSELGSSPAVQVHELDFRQVHSGARLLAGGLDGFAGVRIAVHSVDDWTLEGSIVEVVPEPGTSRPTLGPSQAWRRACEVLAFDASWMHRSSLLLAYQPADGERPPFHGPLDPRHGCCWYGPDRRVDGRSRFRPAWIIRIERDARDPRILAWWAANPGGTVTLDAWTGEVLPDGNPAPTWRSPRDWERAEAGAADWSSFPADARSRLERLRHGLSMSECDAILAPIVVERRISTYRGSETSVAIYRLRGGVRVAMEFTGSRGLPGVPGPVLEWISAERE